MNTPSHFIINAAIAKRWLRGRFPLSALLWGSMLPDLPLIVLTIASAPFYRIMRGWGADRSFDYAFDVLYFENPFWISAHNLLGSPTSLLLLYGLVYGLYRLRRRLDPAATTTVEWWLFGCLLSCGLHAIIDILTHHDDGPLLLFPFNMTVRFYSPVSYWDARHGGDIFFYFEAALFVVLTLYLIAPWLVRHICMAYKRRDQ